MKGLALLISLLVLPVQAGEITGTVVWEGSVPKMKPLNMNADPVCASAHTQAARAETLVLGEGQTMANIFVRIKSGLPDKTWDPPTEAAVIDQHGCVYHPHVVGVMVDQPFKFLNSDETLHNVNVKAKTNRAFNLGMPKNKKEAEHTFSREELLIEVKCNVHPWMKSYIGVISHPFYDVTGEDGTFSITGLDAGTYEIEVWHEKLGTKTQTVTIGADENKTVDFTYSLPKR